MVISVREETAQEYILLLFRIRVLNQSMTSGGGARCGGADIKNIYPLGFRNETRRPAGG